MIKTEKCYECGCEMKSNRSPYSAMGEPMFGRGLDGYYCDNPRCSRFGR